MARGSGFGLTRFGLVGLTVLAFSATCTAQQPAAATRSVVQTVATSPVAQGPTKPGMCVVVNTKELLSDTQLLFTLANSGAQYKTLYDNMFDLFLTYKVKGKQFQLVDTSRPLIFTSGNSPKGGNKNEEDLMISVPIDTQAQFDKYRNALKDIDLKTKTSPQANGVYPIKTKTVQAFLRYDAPSKYAHLSFAKTEQDVLRNGFGFDPKTELGSDDLVVVINGSVQPQKDRKENFERIRKETLGTLKAKAGENPADFELRKVALELQFNELERLFVESEYAKLVLNTDAAAKKTTVRLSIKALPDSSLAKSIELTGKTAAFYSEAALPGAVIQLFLNFPIDSMRKEHIQKYVKLGRPRAKQRIMEGNKPEAQKQVDADIADLMLDVVEGFGGLDSANGFMQVIPAGVGRYTVVGSARLLDGKKFADGIKKFGQREQGQVKLDTETIGNGKNISIHALRLSVQAEKYPLAFGKDQTVYVGTSNDAMWYAAGDNALQILKDMVAKSEAAASKQVNTMGKLDARLLPFVEALEAYRKANPLPPPAPPPPGAKPPRKPKSDGDIRKLALQTFADGKDMIHILLERDAPNSIKLEIVLEEGILTFFGKSAANVVKDTLE